MPQKKPVLAFFLNVCCALKHLAFSERKGKSRASKGATIPISRRARRGEGQPFRWEDQDVAAGAEPSQLSLLFPWKKLQDAPDPPALGEPNVTKSVNRGKGHGRGRDEWRGLGKGSPPPAGTAGTAPAGIAIQLRPLRSVPAGITAPLRPSPAGTAVPRRGRAHWACGGGTSIAEGGQERCASRKPERAARFLPVVGSAPCGRRWRAPSGAAGPGRRRLSAGPWGTCRTSAAGRWWRASAGAPRSSASPPVSGRGGHTFPERHGRGVRGAGPGRGVGVRAGLRERCRRRGAVRGLCGRALSVPCSCRAAVTEPDLGPPGCPAQLLYCHDLRFPGTALPCCLFAFPDASPRTA